MMILRSIMKLQIINMYMQDLPGLSTGQQKVYMQQVMQLLQQTKIQEVRQTLERLIL